MIVRGYEAGVPAETEIVVKLGDVLNGEIAGVILAVTVTDPLNPSRPAISMFDCLDVPGEIDIREFVGEIERSGPVTPIDMNRLWTNEHELAAVRKMS